MAAGNEITVIGNITSDVELQFLDSGVGVARFGVAWNRRFQRDDEWVEEPHFFDVTCWRDLAENVTETFSKGDRVIVVGRLEQSRWEDKKTGEARSKVGITADEVGPSLRWATATLEKVGGDSRGGGGGGGRGESRGRGRDRDDRGRDERRDSGRGRRDDRRDYRADEEPF